MYALLAEFSGGCAIVAGQWVRWYGPNKACLRVLMVDYFAGMRIPGTEMDNTLKTQIRESRKLLQNPYAYLDGDGDFTAIPNNWSGSVHSNLRDLQNPYAFVHNEDDYSKPVSPDTVNRRQYVIDPSPLLGKTKKGGRLSDREIELIARNLQNEMWRHQLDLFPDRQILNPVDIIDPIVALASIGYRTGWSDSLGEYSIEGESVEVAGTIDRSAQVVRISRRFSPEIRNFTAAHELAHAMLHEGVGLHRDRALDGTLERITRESTEREADKFATYFLMPEKYVRIAFERVFKTQKFVLNEETAFALNSDLDTLRSKCKTKRDLSRLLAGATRYDGTPFRSLSEQFHVSIGAMAIRLEELRLIAH